jgi:5-methylcytosine-specific restriction endonuclease McrA
MRRVTPAPEPKHFDKDVRQPGLRAIAEMIGEQPPRTAGHRFMKRANTRDKLQPEDFPTYWTKVLPELKTAYNHICAYSCFRIHPVTGTATVDHFAPKSRHWDQVYEWNNYRLACSQLNSWKKDYGDVLDPFEIEDDWFVLELLGFQVLPNPQLEASLNKLVNETIARLRLNEFCKAREERAYEYWDGDISLKILEREAPFVARELCRQGRLNAEDQ